MKKRVEEYQEKINKILDGEEEFDYSDRGFISFTAGLLIRYFINKRKGDVTIGLITPIYENAKSFKLVKEELKKAMFSFGYEDKLSYKTNNVVANLLTINDAEAVDKDMLLVGLLSNTFEVLKLEKAEDSKDKEESTKKSKNTKKGV